MIGLGGVIAILGWAPQAWPGAIFLTIWTFVSGAIAGVHWVNFFSPSKISMVDAEVDLSTERPSAANRLEEIKTLKSAGLISSEEYLSKRQEILKDL
jgi:hypothetical protein